jgi:hypothetical protein
MTEEITKNARKTLKKKYNYFIKRALQTPFTQKFKNFEIQKQKTKPKLKTNRK